MDKWILIHYSLYGPSTPPFSAQKFSLLENSFIWKYITLLHISKYEFFLKWGNAHLALRVLVPFILSFMLFSVYVCGGMCVHVCVCVCSHVCCEGAKVKDKCLS